MPINKDIIRVLLNNFEKYNTNNTIHVRLIEAQITQKLFLILLLPSTALFTAKNKKNSAITKYITESI